MKITETIQVRVQELGKGPPDFKAYAVLCNDFYEQLLNLSGNMVLCEITYLHYYRLTRIWLGLLMNISWNDTSETLKHEISNTLRALEVDDMLGVGSRMLTPLSAS